MYTYCLGSVGVVSRGALERRLVRSIASNTNVVVSASGLDRNKGAVECITALLFVRRGMLARSYVLSECRHMTMLE